MTIKFPTRALPASFLLGLSLVVQSRNQLECVASLSGGVVSVTQQPQSFPGRTEFSAPAPYGNIHLLLLCLPHFSTYSLLVGQLSDIQLATLHNSCLGNLNGDD